MIAGSMRAGRDRLRNLPLVTVRHPLLDDKYRMSVAQLSGETQVATVIETLLLGMRN